jgi:hypothetical protein
VPTVNVEVDAKYPPAPPPPPPDDPAKGVLPPEPPPATTRYSTEYTAPDVPALTQPPEVLYISN